MAIDEDAFSGQVDRVLGALDPGERIALLHQHTPPVPRLGLTAFHTGAEALHGVAWVGTATHFPQPVALACTWDPELTERVGAVVGTELLAMRANGVGVSRNVWAPVVNPLRHPRWGRNEEGYSEDPHLTADLATGYARGMRGPDGQNWRVVPTLKHFAGYSNETDRAVSSSQLPPRVFHEYELPAFAGPARAAAVGAVMLSYNLINGRPAHLCADLLAELRALAGVELLAVSDAYAPANLWQCERYYPDRTSAYAAALRAGLDSFTVDDANPVPTLEALHAALEAGLIDAADIDRAARRVLLVRARTGELADDPEAPGVLDTPEHRALAREAAGRGVVVLANDGVLPLADLDRVAVIGPLATRVLPDWYSGTPPYRVTVADAARELAGDAVVVDGSDRITLRAPDGAYLVTAPDGAVLASGTTPTAWDVTDWGHGTCTLASADTGLLWTAPGERGVCATAPAPQGWEVQESFRFDRFDDGTVAVQHLGSGRWLRVEVYGGRVVAGALTIGEATRFTWDLLRDGIAEAAAAAAACPTVLCVLGNDPHLLGREAADRPDLALPERMAALWRAARAANPRSVLVLVSSYPYVLDASAREAAAIVWTGHAGQEQGHGILDVLTGAVEPSGRLAQTWWADEADAGDLFDYDILGSSMTYWYNAATPLYAFGHGLTYSSVAYRALSVAVGPDGVEASVTVENTGAREATEVVQVYTSAPDHRLRVPRRLGGYARVRLAPGESRTVTIRVPLDRFQVWDVASDRFLLEPGTYRLTAGPDADTAALVASVEFDGQPHPGRTLPLRAEAFDECVGTRLEEETLEAGTVATAPGGTGALEFRDVTALPAELVARVARTAEGPAAVGVQLRAGGATAWSDEVVAEVPARLGRHEFAEVALVVPAAWADGGDVRVQLRGPVRVAELAGLP
ncbi:MAG: glycoside hydrolase family 3 C-terminal domain-containing protein [Propionicimonas sp.]|uniref:glycoside hydrolase family 3 C-terminal domain-containing protein n=1 Tax=Propionicimonas sp. TaxID=1955623 RepID=UPI003D138F69